MPPDVGYSGTPLVKKLGIKEGHRLAVLHAPAGFLVELELPASVTPSTDWPEATCDVILLFTTAKQELADALPALRKQLTPAGGLWVAWPKKAAKLDTDLTEDVVRALALRNRLVDNKVCAINAIWSGLRLVIRLQDRPQPATPRKP